MSRKTKSKANQTSGTEVQFRCAAQGAQRVCLVGTFNNWDPASTPMQPAEGNEWLAAIRLPSGRHEYKYVVDGIWCCQPGVIDGGYAGDDAVPNEYGTNNRVINV